MNHTIVIIFGTRPEFIKLLPLIHELKKLKTLEVLTINANQQTDLLEHLVKSFGFTADYTLGPLMKPDLVANASVLTERLNEAVKKILETRPIDFILAQGDTTTVYAASMISGYHQIRFAHLEAGLRSFSAGDPHPEEMNRKLIARNTFVHFAPDTAAVKNLMNEDIPKEAIVLTGNTIIDFHKRYFKRRKEKRNLVLVTQHRRSKGGHQLSRLLNACTDLAVRYPHLEFVWPSHPSIKENGSTGNGPRNLKFVPPLNPLELLGLLNRAAVIITDSGGLQEEGVSHGIPVIVTRNFTERMSGVASGRSFLAGDNGELIEPLFEKVIKKWSYVPKKLFGDGRASVKIKKWFEAYMAARPLYNVAFLGFGPAGSGVLINAIQRGGFEKLRSRKILILEKSNSIMKGAISGYMIKSDTLARTFTEFAEEARNTGTKKLKERPSFKKLSGHPANVPLRETNAFLEDAARLYTSLIRKQKNFKLQTGFMVQRIVRMSHDRFRISGIISDGKRFKQEEFLAEKIVMGCGGVQDKAAILSSAIGQTDLKLSSFSEKIIFTDDLFKGKCDERLAGHKKPHIVVLGGSHSAFTAANYLTDHYKKRRSGNMKLRILYRSRPKPFFNSLEEAHAHGFATYTVDDTCPLTKRVNRLSGLRFESKELFLQLEKNQHRNISAGKIPSDEKELHRILSEAHLIIPAFGYVHNVTEMVDHKGMPVALSHGMGRKLVNDQCQVLDAGGKVVENVFAIGLASGFVPSGHLGGEKNFRGQTNGYWLYQHGVGEIIAKQVFGF